MPFRVGPTELIILLIIIIILFGVGRIARLGGDMGKAISTFKKSVSKEEPGEAKKEE